MARTKSRSRKAPEVRPSHPDPTCTDSGDERTYKKSRNDASEQVEVDNSDTEDCEGDTPIFTQLPEAAAPAEEAATPAEEAAAPAEEAAAPAEEATAQAEEAAAPAEEPEEQEMPHTQEIDSSENE